MKDHEYYRSVEVARSILTGENLKQTCEMIDYSGHRFAILHSWREQMLVSAQEDKNRGRMELALLGEIVAELLDQVPPRHSRHFDRSHSTDHMYSIGKNIGELRYDIMLRIAHKLYLGEDVERSILQMLLVSMKYLKREFEQEPITVNIEKYKRRLNIV